MPAQDVGAVRRCYDVVAEDYADHVRGTEPEAAIDIATIAHLATLVPEPRRVLDAGCGAGRLLPLLRDLGCRPHGIDLSPGMVARARRDHPGVPIDVGSLAALPYAAASFDGVLSWYSTIHSPDEALPDIVAELARVVTPGGYVLVASQAGEGVYDSGAHYRRRGHDVELLRWNRGVDVLADMMTTAGLTVALRLERAAVAGEKEPQTVVIARR